MTAKLTLAHGDKAAAPTVPTTPAETPGEASCADCGAVLSGPYCAQCGQHAHIEMPTLWEFVHEYLHHYVALEGKLGRSLWQLLRRPGQLSVDYLVGRRQRYLKPLQLYLTVSFVFFVVLGFQGLSAPADAVKLESVAADIAAGDTRAAEAAALKAAGAPAGVIVAGKRTLHVDFGFQTPALQRWNHNLNARLAKFSANPGPEINAMVKKMRAYTPYGVFFLVPVFAFLLWLTLYRRRLRYGAHLVFALHVHAFAFVVFLLELLPLPERLTGLLSLAVPLYLVLAMKTMYGGRWGALSLRAALLLILYGLCALFTTLVIMLLAFESI